MPGENATTTHGSGSEGTGWDDVSAIAPSVSATPQTEGDTSQSEETQPPDEDLSQQEGTTEGETGQVDGELPEGGETAPTEGDPNAQVKELNNRIATMTAQFEQLQGMANFYAAKYNELVSTQAKPGQTPPITEKPTAIPRQVLPSGQLPQGVIAPEDWNTEDVSQWTSQMGGYLDHRFNDNVNQSVKTIQSQVMEPVMKTVNQRLSTIGQHLIKMIHPDFDEVIKGTIEDVFVTDPSGKTVDIKNPAMLQYFLRDPFPEMAMYRYGLSKKMPQKLKEGVQKETQELLKKVTAKPKGPTQPKKSGIQTQKDELDWDTPPDVRDRILKKKGLL